MGQRTKWTGRPGARDPGDVMLWGFRVTLLACLPVCLFVPVVAVEGWVLVIQVDGIGSGLLSPDSVCIPAQ